MKNIMKGVTERMRGAGIPFQYIRRITGYLAPSNQWSDGKRAELKDRVVHKDDASDSKD